MTVAKKKVVAKKVSTKKVPAKKVTKKKSVATNKKGQKRVLARAEGEQCFWTTDGKIIADLIELRDLLAKIDSEVFAHHVAEKKNDFAEWVEYVLGDTELANALRGVAEPASAKTIVSRRLRIYNI